MISAARPVAAYAGNGTTIAVLGSKQTFKYTFESACPFLDVRILQLAGQQATRSSPYSVAPLEHPERQMRKAHEEP